MATRSVFMPCARVFLTNNTSSLACQQTNGYVLAVSTSIFSVYLDVWFWLSSVGYFFITKLFNYLKYPKF